MSFVVIPMKSREKLLENAKALRQARLEGNEFQSNYLQAWADGFFAAMRCEYESASVGLLVMDYDEVLETGDDSDCFTNYLPRVVANR